MITLPDDTTISEAEASEYLQHYWSNTAPPAYGLFDAGLTGPKNSIEPADILSLNAFNAFAPRNPQTAMAALWKRENREHLETLLSQVTRESLESLDDVERSKTAGLLAHITHFVGHLHSWNAAAAALLLHRLRPGLALPWDKCIDCYYSMMPNGSWEEFFEASLADMAGNYEYLKSALELARTPFAGRTISVVRLWHIVLQVRVQSGLGPPPNSRESSTRIILPDGSMITTETALAHVQKYWQEAALPVYGLFDATVTGSKNRIEPIDVLSLNVLNVFGASNPMSPMAVLWSRENREKIEELLLPVTPEPMENLDEPSRRRAAADLEHVTDFVEQLDGWGRTSASKLVYRLRPGLASPWDTYVNRYYRKPVGIPWADYYCTATDCIAQNINQLLEVLMRASEQFPQRKISLVRLWDMILWIRARDGIGPTVSTPEIWR